MRTKLDQRDSEDTLSLNRQSRVEQDFKAFTSDERMDTIVMIRKTYQKETDINAKRLTCMMIEVGALFSFALVYTRFKAGVNMNLSEIVRSLKRD